MSGVPRSQRLLAYHFAASGQSPAFGCPSNTVVLVKSCYFWNTSAAAIVCYFFVAAYGSGATVVPYYESLAPGTVGKWEGWLVMHPSDYVRASVGAAGVDVYISGAVLMGGPVYPPAELMDPLLLPPELDLRPIGEQAPQSTAGLPESGPSLKGRGRSARRA